MLAPTPLAIRAARQDALLRQCRGHDSHDDLLLHNAGFAPDYPFNGNYDISRETFMTWMLNTTLDYPVGQKYVYSDVSMTALQLVIERISGQTLSAFTQE